MQQAARESREFSPRRIIGFACNQAFLFFVLYFGAVQAGDSSDPVLAEVYLVSLLSFMTLGFVLVRAMGAGRASALFSRPLLYLYAVVAAASSVLAFYVPEPDWPVVLLSGMFVGLPCSLLLTAWGRAFGSGSSADAVPEIFLGSLVAALLCLLFSLFPTSDFVLLATRILPLAGVVNIEISASSKVDVQAPAVIEAESSPARSLSVKILAGTFLFGAATGLMRAFPVGGLFEAGQASAGGMFGFPADALVCQMGVLLFGAFLIGAVTLQLSDGFGRGAALNKSYRLAVFLMMLGVLLAPASASADWLLPGQALILAGYLGLEVVLVSLFVVMADITATDCALSFSVGFAALFAGELIGMLVGGACLHVLWLDAGSLLFVGAAAGAVILVGYIFLFTERDLDMLSEIVSAGDTFEDVCEAITQEFSLSNRESEILTFALRGRTSERIAQELVISKNTVDTHLRRIYAKCDVHSRQELLDLAEEKIRKAGPPGSTT